MGDYRLVYRDGDLVKHYMHRERDLRTVCRVQGRRRGAPWLEDPEGLEGLALCDACGVVVEVVW